MKPSSRFLKRALTYGCLALWAGLAYRSRILSGSPTPEDALDPFLMIVVLMLVVEGLADVLRDALDCIYQIEAEQDLDADTGETVSISLTEVNSKATLPASSSNPST